MYLLVDAGNSSIKWNVYDSMRKQFLLSPQGFLWRDGEITSLLQQHWGALADIHKVLLANVGGLPVQESLQKFAQAKWKTSPLQIDTQANAFGVSNAYRIPNQLGVDRWLGVLAAHNMMPQRQVCVISCGTAITVDTVTMEGRHLGGLIVPGLHLMTTSLLQQTHGIKIEQSENGFSPFTESTTAAVNHGVRLAATGFIERAVYGIENELGNEVTKIITGGDAERLVAHTRYQFTHEPQLVLKGLALYADENR